MKEKKKKSQLKINLPRDDGGREKFITCLFLWWYFLIKSIKSHISTDTRVWVLFENLHADWLPRQLAEFFIWTHSWLTATSLQMSCLLFYTQVTAHGWNSFHHWWDVTEQNMCFQMETIPPGAWKCYPEVSESCIYEIFIIFFFSYVKNTEEKLK